MSKNLQKYQHSLNYKKVPKNDPKIHEVQNNFKVLKF